MHLIEGITNTTDVSFTRQDNSNHRLYNNCNYFLPFYRNNVLHCWYRKESGAFNLPVAECNIQNIVHKTSDKKTPDVVFKQKGCQVALGVLTLLSHPSPVSTQARLTRVERRRFNWPGIIKPSCTTSVVGFLLPAAKLVFRLQDTYVSVLSNWHAVSGLNPATHTYALNVMHRANCTRGGKERKKNDRAIIYIQAFRNERRWTGRRGTRAMPTSCTLDAM